MLSRRSRQLTRRSAVFLWMPLICLLTTLWLSNTPAAVAAPTLSHADKSAQAYIISPTDGQDVPSEFTVKFGLSGMGVAPAGVDKEGTGHHHLLIDVDELPPLTEPLAATSQIRHFGGGQTETTLDLTPGEHTLQLVLGNYTHVPHDNPVISEKIKVTVE
ncbi:MAG: DUF4399 domain-containing protein [Cyanobacteria bacterium P01_C01_bin.121]